MKIIDLSPYRWHPFAYPEYRKFVECFSDVVGDAHLGKLYLRVLASSNGKVRHIIAYLFLPMFILSRPVTRGQVIFVVFGVYQTPIAIFLGLLGLKCISYQPELFEFKNRLLLFFFRVHLSYIDFLLDVDHSRLKIRRRFFRRSEKSWLVLHNTSVIEKPPSSPLLRSRERGSNHRGCFFGTLSQCGADVIKNFSHSEKIPVDIYSDSWFVIEDENNDGLIQFFEPVRIQDIDLTKYTIGLVAYPRKAGPTNINERFINSSKVLDYIQLGLTPIILENKISSLKGYVVPWNNGTSHIDSQLDEQIAFTQATGVSVDEIRKRSNSCTISLIKDFYEKDFNN